MYQFEHRCEVTVLVKPCPLIAQVIIIYTKTTFKSKQTMPLSCTVPSWNQERKKTRPNSGRNDILLKYHIEETLYQSVFEVRPTLYCISGYVRVVINFAFFANLIFSRNLKHSKLKTKQNSARKSPYSRSKNHTKLIF